MSKQAKAKAHQGYEPKPVSPTCGNCEHFASEKRLPEWMATEREDWAGRPYTAEKNGVEKDLRCLAGGFAVKKTATCRLFEMRGKALENGK